ncbi:hypothetical protein MCOR22_008321 [Pyricularia oryzae]|nr:hypothetical protein MCOR22_008321 [Pyricularia oryzae]
MCHYGDPDLLTCQSCRTPYSDPSKWELTTYCAAFLAGPYVLLRCSEEPTFPGQSFGVTPEGNLCRRCSIIFKARGADKDHNSSSSSTNSEATSDPNPTATADGSKTPLSRNQERLERLMRMRTARMSRWTAHGMPDAHAGRPVNAEGNQGEESGCVPHSCPFGSKCRYGCASMQERLARQQMENMLRRRRPDDMVNGVTSGGGGGDGDGNDADEVPPVPRCPFTPDAVHGHVFAQIRVMLWAVEELVPILDQNSISHG